MLINWWRRWTAALEALFVRVDVLAQADSLRAIREAMLKLLPCLLLSSFLLLIATVLDWLQWWPTLARNLHGMHDIINKLFPYLVTASIGYTFGALRRVSRFAVALLCAAYLGMVHQFLLQLDDQRGGVVIFDIFAAVISPLLAVPMLARFTRWRWAKLTHTQLVSENITGALNLVIPAVMTGLIFMAGMSLVIELCAWMDASIKLSIENLIQQPCAGGLLLSGLNSVLWFFGIHGYHSLSPLFDLIDSANQVNHHVSATGAVPHFLNSSFMGSFVFIGGSGATLSLAFSILIFSKSRDLRLLAWASLPIGFLNINEILLYGLPIIFNLRVLLAFVAAPMINVFLAMTVMQLGWVNLASYKVPLTSPVGMNAWVSTGGDYRAILLQIALIGIGILVYMPSVRRLSKSDKDNIDFSLNGHHVQIRHMEDVQLYGKDPLSEATHMRYVQSARLGQLQKFSRCEFFLEFQPQICKNSRTFVGTEALLRCRDAQGKVYNPGHFMDCIKESGLMPEIDVWVASAAARQYRIWVEQGQEIPITINITAESLADPWIRAEIIKHLSGLQGGVSVELTEATLVKNIEATHQSIGLLHEIGAKVYIDDFGSGFSALNYLHQFDIDAIKIDRSFVLALKTERGVKVMDGMLGFAKEMKLSVVIEGVEEESQLMAIRADTPITIQGWLFSKSMLPELIPDFVAKFNGKPSKQREAVFDPVI